MVGQKLRKAREGKNITIEDVYKATRIQPQIISALEEDKLDNTLGMAYVRSFLKSYAAYLGLDAGRVVDEYSRTAAVKPGDKPALKGKTPDFAYDRHKRAAITAVVTLAGFAILLFASVEFIRTANSSWSIKKAEQKAPAAQRPDAALLSIPKKGAISLTIAVDKDVWLKVIQDGQTAFHGILSKNSRETYQAANDIVLTEIGRPESLALKVNGKDIDLSGKKTGKTIRITSEGIELDARQRQ